MKKLLALIIFLFLLVGGNELLKQQKSLQTPISPTNQTTQQTDTNPTLSTPDTQASISSPSPSTSPSNIRHVIQGGSQQGEDE